MANMASTLDYIINKYHLKVGRQYIIVEIPNINRDDLAKLFAELGFTLGAEIGVLAGGYSEVLCQVNPKLKLFSIDSWKTTAYEPKLSSPTYSQRQFDNFYRQAKRRLSPYNCHISKKESQAAVGDFKDASLDFVYIDANHDFVNVATDLHTWKKKVKSGGIISGHDYAYFPSWKYNHVKHVLLAYTKAYGIKPLFIVGTDGGKVRDRFRSWFFVNA